MNPRAIIAATAAIASVLILQAMVISPLAATLAISLPAVFVATVGLQVGATVGMSAGFATGLVADLGSDHPAGILALAWLVLGLTCGLLADAGRRARLSVLLIAASSGAMSLLVVLVLDLLVTHHVHTHAWVAAIPGTLVGDLALAVLLYGPVRAVARANRGRSRRRAPSLVGTDA